VMTEAAGAGATTAPMNAMYAAAAVAPRRNAHTQMRPAMAAGSTSSYPVQIVTTLRNRNGPNRLSERTTDISGRRTGHECHTRAASPRFSKNASY
jgi:hypothetical protein